MIKKIAFKLILVGYVLVSTLFIASILNPNMASAADTTFESAEEAAPVKCTPTGGSFLGLPAWYKYLEGNVEQPSGRCVPVLSGDDEEGQINSALPIGLAILEGMLRISSVVAVVMIFWAGFKYILSQGNGDAAAGARKTAINAMIGLTIVIFATTFVSFAGNSLLSGAEETPATSDPAPTTEPTLNPTTQGPR